MRLLRSNLRYWKGKQRLAKGQATRTYFGQLRTTFLMCVALRTRA